MLRSKPHDSDSVAKPSNRDMLFGLGLRQPFLKAGAGFWPPPISLCGLAENAFAALGNCNSDQSGSSCGLA
jgi:hypothetical protein